MPGYKTHLLGGGISFIALFSGMGAQLLGRPSLEITILYFLSALCGSLFPDIDIASKMQRLFFLGVVALSFYFLATSRNSLFFLVSGLVLFVLLLKHRTLTHQVSFLITVPLFLVITSVYLYKVSLNMPLNAVFFFIVGALSHVFLDRFQSKLKLIFKRKKR